MTVVTVDPQGLLRRRLTTLVKDWPKGYWVWVASGSFHLMCTDAEGQRAYTEGSVDPKYIVETFDVPADGGDW